MSIESLRLQNFRNYRTMELTLSPGVNLIVGPNAQGKTNLLESLFLLSSGRLLRGMKDSEAILTGESRAEVEGVLADSGTELKIVLEAGIRKRAYLNHASLPRASDLLGRLPSVIFSNDDLGIVRDDASARRMFLDAELSQIYPAYLRHFATYKRALEQRNALLRHADGGPVDPALLEPWDAQLSEHGDAMRAYRREFVEELLRHGKQIQCELASGEDLRLEYQSKDSGSLKEALDQSRVRDVQRGTTSVGPHRDDLLILVAEREARLYGSQGQQRTAAITLKLATMRIVASTLGVPPMILLDDVFSELDQDRRAHLLDWVDHVQAQTFLTCTEAEQAGDAIGKSASIFCVSAGTVMRG